MKGASGSAWLVTVAVASFGLTAGALEMDRLRVQRKEVFEFAEKPTVTLDGDQATISFASKDFCDATVAIEDATGKIIRHLASGVLGKNAPRPFQKDSLRQTVVWDGKDEIGRYVDDKESITVRVSLGLMRRFERTLYWSEHKMADARAYPLVKAAPEGVYVFFPGHGPQVRLFDHQGNYVRTVFPFPADKIAKVPGVAWQEFPPDNERLPSKLLNHDQDTVFLPAADVREIVVAGSRILLVSAEVAEVGTDGSGGTGLAGLNVSYPAAGYDKESETLLRPYSAAVSPDGKRLYLAAYSQMWSHYGYGKRSWGHGVSVVPLEKDGKLAPFVGVPQKGKAAAGSDEAHFACPMSVACDAQGRVYVADNLNNRIQVFLPDGKLLKSIPSPRPGIVRLHPKTGAICVISSGVCITDELGIPHADKGVAATVRFLGPVEDPKETASYPLDVPGNDYGRLFSIWDANVEVDFYTEPPTVWMAPAPTGGGERPHTRCAIRLLRPEGTKLVLTRNFAADAEKAVARFRAPKFGRPRLWVNPANGLLYLGLITWDTSVACKSFQELVVIQPETGRITVAALPTDAEDVGFDWLGHAHLRCFDGISRFDPTTWREVPFDYGDERLVYHGQGGGGEKPFPSASAITLPSGIGGMFHMGGMGIAPDGTIVVSCINPSSPAEKDRMKEKNVQALAGRRAYTPPIYPGRNAGWETHIFDKHGNILKEDVAPGIGVSNFLQIDRDRNVYVLAASTPYLDGKPYLNGRGCTLIKLKPGKMKALTPGGIIPLPEAARPKRPMDMTRPGMWVEGAEWLFGPVGADGHYGSGGKCSCYVNGRFALDYFGRSFAPEVDRFRAVVLDTNGNVIVRIGKYGNVDDGLPLVKEGGPPVPRPIGGDETAIMHAMNVAVHTDRRFFLADIGNQCIRSVKLGYHAEEKVALKGVKDQGKKPKENE